MSASSDTIYALSSGSLPAGVAVIRISGAGAFDALRTLSGLASLTPRVATLRTIRSTDGEPIDQSLLISFPAPNSFTGEDCLEIHVHGGRAVVNAIFGILERIPAFRPAEAGEFSQRAFNNGKMDLLEIEGLADLLKAETEMQRRLAVEQTSGRLSQLYDDWATQLTKCRAFIEAELDFSDEDDVPDSVASQVWKNVHALKNELVAHIGHSNASEIIRDGFKVALIGPPNVGKSSLMNVLAGRDIAIVTDVAGTTRDVLSVDLNIDGYLVTLLDTAGLRETSDVIEQEGVRRARNIARAADLVLNLSDIDSPPEQLPTTDGVVQVFTKSDLSKKHSEADHIAISSKTGDGIAELQSQIKKAIEKKVGASSTLIPARERHKKRLEETLNYVTEALNFEGRDLAVRSEYLRLAATSLGRITGRVDVEELLGVIFSEFCIGK
ncbi:tRNA uridine-5-carboxymethylaminomethyl(34) synthesis GTPase MnmE [Agrobacterium larrymoorei]|uniref:tRNA uridine-5-carboxymethylaminomethyl(34) synthesis GTPase MnmE n=1 Tax=Agrobacterium larrymoorei TaxID=160699 RepID=UPI00157317B3|nr:tRNA uridine-5-carboxymethylaminomethyl(34) synthesis GTPase MnmE [Agrobacterium larrymoorei]NTJ43474.1 tRNA uridine-5-carboxymethylaminomethyl(34) synthesis GTPase MnmE [Agrobacterium larrymoorei]